VVKETKIRCKKFRNLPLKIKELKNNQKFKTTNHKINLKKARP